VSTASLARAKPSFFTVPADSRTPAVIAISYVCHDHRRKSAFSFIVCKSFVCHRVDASLNRFYYLAVVVADASVFSAIWGAFMAVASYYASRENFKVQSSFEKQPFAGRAGSSDRE
jgi:hypothetical protein